MPGYNAKPNTAKTEGGLLLRLTYFFYRDCVIRNQFSKNEFLISFTPSLSLAQFTVD